MSYKNYKKYIILLAIKVENDIIPIVDKVSNLIRSKRKEILLWQSIQNT